MSNSYGAVHQNMMVVVQQMIDEAIRSREIKQTVENLVDEQDQVESTGGSYLKTLVSIRSKLEGTPSVSLFRENTNNEDLLTRAVLTYPSGYYTSYNLFYETVREGIIKTTEQLSSVTFSIYTDYDEQVLTISIGLNYNSKGQIEGIDVNDGSWE